MKKFLVKKEDKATLSNILNEMFYEEKMTLQELRFFLVYLSKINPKKPDETEVTFTLEDYAEILGVELNESTINKVTRKLLRYIVSIRPKELDESDEYDMGVEHVQLFSKSKMLRRKKDGKWFFTFSCHEDIKGHLFNLKREYTSLEVWNIINLNNFQDARMYMLLKQYRNIGERTIQLDELKKMLGIEMAAYPEYKIFSRDVLKKCQKSLKEKTDLTFDFHAVGRPAKAVYFTIYSNKDYTPPAFLTKSKAIMELPADEGKEKVEEEAELTISERRDIDRIQEFRDLMKENNPEWEESDARIIEMCDLINEHLLTIDQHMNLSEYSRDVSRYDFIHAVLKRANSEDARNLYKFFMSQWERYKYGDEKGNGQVWIWD